MDIISGLFDVYGSALILFVFIVLFVLESRFVLRKRVQLRWSRVKTNILVALPSILSLRLLFLPAIIYIASENEKWQFGIIHWIELSVWMEFIIGFLLLDYLIYIWHWMTHKIPLLWRFHSVHHTDADLDLTTALRFHFGELWLSVIFRGAFVLIVGASPLLVIVYEIVFEVAVNFHHSNWRLNKRLEKCLNSFIVTPRMHGIHHSIIRNETDSNFSTIFSWWDRIHRTFLLHKAQDEITIGIPDHREWDRLTVWQLFTLPFRSRDR